MDPEQLAQWRARLARAHGSWLCPICKCAYASQAQFDEMTGIVELVRHRECGHVLMWRSGGADWLAPYLAEPMMAELLPMPRLPAIGPRRVAIEPAHWSRHHDACVECGQTDKPHASRGNCTRCDGRVRWRNRR